MKKSKKLKKIKNLKNSKKSRNSKKMRGGTKGKRTRSSTKRQSMVSSGRVETAAAKAEKEKAAKAAKAAAAAAAKKILKNRPLIIPTFIPLIDRYTLNNPNPGLQNHAVLLIKDTNRQLYLFDPNGEANDSHTYHYADAIKDISGNWSIIGDFMGNLNMTSIKLQIYVKNKFGLNLIVPNRPGVQSQAPVSQTGFIHDGGYCMFYMREALEYLANNINNNANMLWNKLIYWENSNVFSLAAKIQQKSVKLVTESFHPHPQFQNTQKPPYCEEFCQFYPYSGVTGKMVDEDRHCDYFYKNPSPYVAPFEPNFFEALKKIKYGKL